MSLSYRQADVGILANGATYENLLSTRQVAYRYAVGSTSEAVIK